MGCMQRTERAEIDDVDRLLLNNLQGDFPVMHRPFREVAERLGLTEDVVIERLHRMVESGALSRFGTILNAPQLGGERTLAAMHVPGERFEQVSQFVNGLDAVSHNYERTGGTDAGKHFNMWFVISSEDEREIAATIERIQKETGLDVIDLPTLEEYFVDIRFKF
jgi:DNA-binding Lrp family transcriptional regulator